MKQIKVCLQYPLGTFGKIESSHYKYLLNFPPKGVSYINKKKFEFISGEEKKFRRLKRSKELLKTLTFNRGVPNITFTTKKCDLIYCGRCLSINKKPWIVDFEYIWSLVANASPAKVIPFHKYVVKKLLKRNSCKKILPRTEDAKKTLYDWFKDPIIRKKTEILYSVAPPHRFKKIKHDKLILLFIARFFYDKGGDVVVKVFDELRKKYDINPIIISQVPTAIIKKYKDIKFLPLQPQVKLFNNYFPKADIFVYPGFADSFSFAITEAMSFGLPVVTVDGFARKEIVSDGKTGFVVKRDNRKTESGRKKIIEALIEKTSTLIENSSLRQKMGKEARKETVRGKFSIAERNKKLRRIYEEALR